MNTHSNVAQLGVQGRGVRRGVESRDVGQTTHAHTYVLAHTHTSPPFCIRLTFLDHSRLCLGLPSTRWHVPTGVSSVSLSSPDAKRGLCPYPPAVFWSGTGRSLILQGSLYGWEVLSPSFGRAHFLPVPGAHSNRNYNKWIDTPPTFMVAVAVASPQVRGGGPEHSILTWIPSIPPAKPEPRLVTEECFVPA